MNKYLSVGRIQTIFKKNDDLVILQDVGSFPFNNLTFKKKISNKLLTSIKKAYNENKRVCVVGESDSNCYEISINSTTYFYRNVLVKELQILNYD